MMHECLPKCSCSAFIACFLLQPHSSYMCKTMPKAINELRDGANGNGLWKLPTSYKAPCAQSMVHVCLPKCSCSALSHGLSPNHPHHTCARPCRKPSKSYKMGAEAEGCEKCPLATRPHVHKMCVSPNVLVVPSLHAFFSNHTHHTSARPCRRPSMS